ncbi:MAG TPA: hypothetical protein VGD40_12010 [Chryseosolibacter sp.]
MKLKIILLIAFLATRNFAQAQDPITLIAGTLIPKLVEGANNVIDKVREHKTAAKSDKDKKQRELDKAIKEMQNKNAENLDKLSKSVTTSNVKVTELKAIYENAKELLYPLGKLQALTDNDLHTLISNSTDLKRPFIANYLTTWNAMKPYFDAISKLQNDKEWKDESNKIALINDVKATFQKLNDINGVVSRIKDPAPATPDADIEQYRKMILATADEIEHSKDKIIEILDLLTARLSISQNEAEAIAATIAAEKAKIVVPQ